MSNSFEHVEQIADILVRHYGRQDLGNKQNPFDELLFIILSAKTPPQKYQQAYKALKTHYPNHDDFALAQVEQLAGIISFAGLENKKAKQIIEAAIALEKNFGAVTLTPLENKNDADAEEFLITLPGIGLKSARCILLYSLNRKVFPADNHCLRIAQRIGWITVADFSKRVANSLQNGIPPNLRRDLHVGMVLLGRERCLPRKPNCKDCPILRFCEFGLSVE